MVLFNQWGLHLCSNDDLIGSTHALFLVWFTYLLSNSPMQLVEVKYNNRSLISLWCIWVRFNEIQESLASLQQHSLAMTLFTQVGHACINVLVVLQGWWKDNYLKVHDMELYYKCWASNHTWKFTGCILSKVKTLTYLLIVSVLPPFLTIPISVTL